MTKKLGPLQQMQHQCLKDRKASPAVTVPQEQAYVVDNGWLAKLDLNARAAVIIDGMPGKSMIQVIILSVTIQQG